jgi:hypothetical protein
MGAASLSKVTSLDRSSHYRLWVIGHRPDPRRVAHWDQRAASVGAVQVCAGVARFRRRDGRRIGRLVLLDTQIEDKPHNDERRKPLSYGVRTKHGS